MNNQKMNSLPLKNRVAIVVAPDLGVCVNPEAETVVSSIRNAEARRDLSARLDLIADGRRVTVPDHDLESRPVPNKNERSVDLPIPVLELPIAFDR